MQDQHQTKPTTEELERAYDAAWRQLALGFSSPQCIAHRPGRSGLAAAWIDADQREREHDGDIEATESDSNGIAVAWPTPSDVDKGQSCAK